MGQIDIQAAIDDAERLLQNDPHITAPVRTLVSVLLLVIKLLMVKAGMNSRNSRLPPSQDPHRPWRKNSVEPGAALSLLFGSKWPRFLIERFGNLGDCAE